MLGAGIVALLAVFLGWIVWSASIGGGASLEFGGVESNSAGAVFGFLAASIASLQVLTRVPHNGTDKLRALARNEVLSYVALILVPVALAAGVAVLLPALTDAPERLDVARLFGFGGASLLLAVFAADASLASDELMGKEQRRDAAKENHRARLENELRWLMHKRRVNTSPWRDFLRWAVFGLLPVGLLSVLVVTASTGDGAGWGIVVLVVPIFPLTAIVVGAFVSGLTRRQRLDAVMIAATGSIVATFLVISFVIVWMPVEPSVGGIRVREVALNVAMLLSVMAGSLIWSSLASGPNGPLRQISICRARGRLKKIGSEKSAISRLAASPLAWVSFASAVLLPPVGLVIARVGLSQSCARTPSRRMFWWAIAISVVEIALVIAVVICVALVDPEWTDPVPGFLQIWVQMPIGKQAAGSI